VSIFLQIPLLPFLVWSDNSGMRRWMFMAALSAALLATPLWGQRAGRAGMAMGGMRGGGYIPQRGGSVAVSGGAYPGGGFRGTYGRGAYGFSGHSSYYPGRYPYFRCHYPWGWGYQGYYGYPLAWGWDGGGGVGWSSGADYSYPAESYPAYDSATADNLSAYLAYDQQEQIDRLNDEVARLRAERVQGASGIAAAQPPPTRIPANTIFVFRDHRSEEIQDYAIVGKTLWMFTDQRARKVPVAELDLPATTKANEARGIEFRLPTRQQKN
jgi:uncharacterized small protein (DUF1192 family)